MEEEHVGEVERMGARQRGHRAHHRIRRTQRLWLKLAEEEYVLISEAAEREGLATGAYVAQVACDAASGLNRPEQLALRELMVEVMRLDGQVRRVGVNLNQAVAALNSTGEFSEALVMYAAVVARTMQRVDELAEALHRKLR